MIDALAIFLIILPLALVIGATLIQIDTLPFLPTLLEIANVFITIYIPVDSLTLKNIPVPKSNVNVTIKEPINSTFRTFIFLDHAMVYPAIIIFEVAVWGFYILLI